MESSSSSELFICFTSRHSSSSSSIKTSYKPPILSPGRARDPPIALSTSLSRRLRTSGSIKNGQASPMFPTAGRKRGSGFENPEPSSPKVTCIGQVRVKTKKKGQKIRALSRRQSGQVSFRKIQRQSSVNSQYQQQQECSAHRNQRWVHLPLTICDSLKEFSCLLPCKPSCFSTSEKEEDRVGRQGNGGGQRWLVAVQDGGEGGIGREIDLVMEGDEEEEEEEEEERPTRRSRRHVFDEIEIKDDIIQVKDNEGGEGRLSICVPPKNALLLMRCRSDPVKMEALASRFSERQQPTNKEEERENDEEKIRNEEKPVNAEKVEIKDEVELVGKENLEVSEEERVLAPISVDIINEEQENHSEAEETLEMELQEHEEEKLIEDLQPNDEEEPTADLQPNEEEKPMEDLEKPVEVLQNNDEEKPLEDFQTNEEAEPTEDSQTNEEKEQTEDSQTNEEVQENQEETKNKILAEEENERSFTTALEALVDQESEDVDKNNLLEENSEEESRISYSNACFSINSDEEICEEEDEELAEEVASELDAIKSNAEKDKEDVTMEVKVVENVTQEEEQTSEEEEKKGSQGTEKTERETDSNVGRESEVELKKEEKESSRLPECLLLMMCEPKLSMEVSKETWVCSTDFMRWHHQKKKPVQPVQVKQLDGGDDEPTKKKVSVDSKSTFPPHPAHQQPLVQPPRSSCSLPAAAAAMSMAAMIEQKLVNAVAYEPFVLTRCKSAPIRTASAKLKLAPDACFWKNRTLEPHRRATFGIGAAGLGF